jgi:hypothetical protein
MNSNHFIAKYVTVFFALSSNGATRNIKRGEQLHSVKNIVFCDVTPCCVVKIYYILEKCAASIFSLKESVSVI